MQNGDIVSKTGPEAANELGGQGNLGHEHQGTRITLQASGDGAQVHLCLSRPGDPMQQERAGVSGLHRRLEHSDGLTLSLGRLGWHVSFRRVAKEGIGWQLAGLDVHQTEGSQPLHRSACTGKHIAQASDRSGAIGAQVGEYGRSCAAKTYRLAASCRGRRYLDHTASHFFAHLRVEQAPLAEFGCALALESWQGAAQDFPIGAK